LLESIAPPGSIRSKFNAQGRTRRSVCENCGRVVAEAKALLAGRRSTRSVLRWRADGGQKNKLILSPEGNSAGTLAIIQAGCGNETCIVKIVLALPCGKAYCRSWQE
jgi:hypothetical protein